MPNFNQWGARLGANKNIFLSSSTIFENPFYMKEISPLDNKIAKLNSNFNFNFSLSFELSIAYLSNFPTTHPTSERKLDCI